MRKVLIIEVLGTAGEDLLDAAQELGVEAIVATHEDVYEDYSPEVKAKISEVVFTDFSDQDKAVEQLTEYAREAGVNGVVACWEFLSPVVTRLAAALGLPGHRVDLADACRNKRLMAEVFGEAGVPAPRTLTAHSLAEAEATIRDSGLEYPVVVKPAENAGSVGVSVVHSAAELQEAFESAGAWPVEFPHGIPLDTTVLIQEYLGGKEFSVESAVHRGTIHHLAVTEKFTTDDAARAETGHTVPAALAPAAREAVLDTVEKALKALGFTDGIAHLELKLLPEGVAKVIEVGARPPGDHIMKLVRHALGVSEPRAYLQIALGDTPDLTPTHDGAAAIRFFTPPRAGIFKGLHGLPEDPAVIETVLYREPGDELKDARDNLARVGQVILRADSAEEVNRLADALLTAVTVEVE
ncbi:ATP-grasp domain-containing protein [Streptomyces curacoi]|uniref:Carboxylase n=1 Tax=Streptomyces curacoi TaxID=146536 RepID=A0A124H5X0_9ACTN|nr:ATP-grasp domain-containing protein [Streptomyces curacoi]KUM79772.1 carboxylase [Streptomyces curacoi]